MASKGRPPSKKELIAEIKLVLLKRKNLVTKIRELESEIAARRVVILSTLKGCDGDKKCSRMTDGALGELKALQDEMDYISHTVTTLNETLRKIKKEFLSENKEK